MFLLSLFKILVHLILELLTKSAHLILLLLHQFCLGWEDLFMTRLRMFLRLKLFHLVSFLLNFVSFLIVFLFGQVLLNFTLIEQLSWVLERHGQIFLQILSVLLKLHNMSVFGFFAFLLILLLNFLDHFIPMLVELLILLYMSWLDFFLSLLVIEGLLLELHVKFLLLKFLDSVVRHLSLYHNQSYPNGWMKLDTAAAVMYIIRHNDFHFDIYALFNLPTYLPSSSQVILCDSMAALFQKARC